VAGADQGSVGQDDVPSQDRIPGDASPRRDRATGDTRALSLRSMLRRASSSRAACPDAYLEEPELVTTIIHQHMPTD
jgi:hypothetical protein